MALSVEKKNAIEELLRKTIKNKLVKYSRETTSMPFLESIIQDNEKVAAYSFIHSIATSLGQSIFEQVSVILARKGNDTAENGYKIEGTISSNQEQVISNIMRDLKSGTRTADIKAETSEILNASAGTGKVVKSKVDFYMCRNDEKYFFEIKTAKPNIDVFNKTKTKLLEWVAIMGEPINVCMALPYNPYFPEPYDRFTKEGMMDHPNDFLVAEEYWDFIGAKGNFIEILDIFDRVGKEFKAELNNKFKEIADKKNSIGE